MRDKLLLVVALLLVPGAAAAQGNSAQDLGSASGYLSSLSADERKEYGELKADWDKRLRSNPATFTKFREKLLVQAQMILGRFGYGTKFTGIRDAETVEALRNYQAHKGIPVSGELDALTYYSVTSDDEVAEKQLVDFGSYHFGWYDDYFSGGGAWDRMNTSEGSVQSSELECFRDRNVCVETDATALKVLGISTIGAKVTEFSITKWDKFELIAEDASPDCERDELRINHGETTVSLISTPTYKHDFCQKTLGKPETITYALVDGTKIYWQRETENSKRKASLYLFSPRAKEIIDAKD
jgi:hypothetical protein